MVVVPFLYLNYKGDEPIWNRLFDEMGTIEYHRIIWGHYCSAIP